MFSTFIFCRSITKALKHRGFIGFRSARLLPSERIARFPLCGGEGGVRRGNASDAGMARVRHGINIELAYLLSKAAEHKERQNFCSARLLPSGRIIRFPLRGGEGGVPTGGQAPLSAPPFHPPSIPPKDTVRHSGHAENGGCKAWTNHFCGKFGSGNNMDGAELFSLKLSKPLLQEPA